jgi:hypothetical protein
MSLKSRVQFNKRIAMESGTITSIGGRIFGEESLKKRAEFDTMIVK